VGETGTLPGGFLAGTLAAQCLADAAEKFVQSFMLLTSVSASEKGKQNPPRYNDFLERLSMAGNQTEEITVC
jgi:hypothetical protein